MSMEPKQKAPGAKLFYLVAVLSTGLSVNTSWRFFGDKLHITDTAERSLLFAVLEVALIACAWAMRANVRHNGKPGSVGMFAWALTAVAGYMAIVESGPIYGTGRVILGPLLGLASLHFALGIELRHSGKKSDGTLAKVGHELRERALSRLGLGDDARDALTRTQHRAALRAAQIAAKPKQSNRNARQLAKALQVAGVAHDGTTREIMLSELAVLRHAQSLCSLDLASPWATVSASPEPAAQPDGSSPGEPDPTTDLTDDTVIMSRLSDIDFEPSDVTGDRAVLDNMTSAADRIRYALRNSHAETARDVVAWLGALGYTVTLDNVRSVIRRERDRERGSDQLARVVPLAGRPDHEESHAGMAGAR